MTAGGLSPFVDKAMPSPGRYGRILARRCPPAMLSDT